ncbi:MAG: hypothetical protein M3O36_19490 [Myxococcota bacterium]|nr:hypothetical protein [Myxococcota bacterium]
MTRASSRSTARVLALALGAALTSFACDEKKTTESHKSDAGTDKYATADPKLEKALRASSSSASESGPPPEGIFAAGVADQRHPKGVAAKLDSPSDGSEPRVSLLRANDAGDAARAKSYGPAVLELGMQMGPRVAMPTIDFGLGIGPARKDDGGADWILAEVKRAVAAKEQPGQLPAGSDHDIASLAGTSLRVKATADGLVGELDVQLGKGTRPEFERLAETAAEDLAFSTVPLPSNPVGVGAQWIAEARMPFGGIDAITYSAYRVKSIEGERVRLELKVKAYASSKDVHLQGIPKGASLEQFDGQAQGELELVRGEVLARKSTVQQRVVMVLLAAGGAQGGPAPGEADPSKPPAGNMLTAQIQSQATLVRGEDLRSAARQP